MSHPQTPDPLTTTIPHAPPYPSGDNAGDDAGRAVAETIRQLRAEIAATADVARQARLLNQIGELQERSGDESAATRDYLAASSADPAFREPLEGLVRLLERRRAIKNMGRLVDALVAAAPAPDEKVRALLLR
ncbi:MAG: hypothetical protein ACREJ3_06745, partial [Polyangiaceae bacterium]